MLQILRVLLPSWKFFDGTAEAPELFYRISGPNEGFGEWILCIPKVGPRSFKNLWVNANENFLFASHALLEFLKDDLNEDSDGGREESSDENRTAHTSLTLVENLVRFQIRAAKLSAKQFQFRVGIHSDDEADALYTSTVLEVTA